MRRFLPLAFAAALISVVPAPSQAFTQVKIRNPDSSVKSDAVATFGMVFRVGHVPKGKALNIAGADYQVDEKATHFDGSLRHAVISVYLGSIPANDSKTLTLTAGAAPAAGSPISAADVLKTEFDALVAMTLGGAAYTASARDGLAAGRAWLSGPLCTEWLITAPLKNAAGAAHPHLHARFGIRAYQGLKKIRADITVENAWAYEPNPSGFTYDVSLTVGKDKVYTKAGLAHTHHARWRKVFWWGGDPNLDPEYERDYLLDSEAFPQYDRSVKPSADALAKLKPAFEPMANGNLTSFMPGTGAHEDIGPLPHYAALYLLSQDARARRCVLGNGEAGGAFQIHYRDKVRDMPLSVDDYPYVTLLGNPQDTKNPKTGQFESFPAVSNGLQTHDPDDAHQPSIGYLPYVISGDYFHLEELQFWAQWNMIEANPVYRGHDKGLLIWGQTRGQAWSMRTLGQAAYITPDAHPHKKYFSEKVANNIAGYIAKYPNNPSANTLGYLEGHTPYPPYGLAPWMDDFFTFAMGYLVQLGFTDAKPMALWKAKFVVGRMMDPGYCWLRAGIYELQVGTSAIAPYKSLAEIYKANFPTATCTGVKMEGYPDSPTGYPANMQPALAMAVDVGAPGAKEAWAKYMTRSPRQDYSMEPQWAVVPDPNPPSSKIKPRPNVAPGGARNYHWYLPGTRFGYELPQAAEVFAEVFDTSGRHLGTVPLGNRAKGRHVSDPLGGEGAAFLGSAPRLLRIKALPAGARAPLYLPASPAAP